MSLLYHVSSSQLNVEQYRDICAKALGCPCIGTEEGGGIHIEPGVTPVANGAWLLGFDEVEKHPAQDLWKHGALDISQVGDPGNLTAGELTIVNNALASAVEIDYSWVT